jgi:hypothetical protein
MSITKLKTVGNWHTTNWYSNAVAKPRTNVRGRVITGMLTGGDSCLDAAPSPRISAENGLDR